MGFLHLISTAICPHTKFWDKTRTRRGQDASKKSNMFDPQDSLKTHSRCVETVLRSPHTMKTHSRCAKDTCIFSTLWAILRSVWATLKCSAEPARPRSCLFQFCFAHGVFQSQWKCASVIPSTRGIQSLMHPCITLSLFLVKSVKFWRQRNITSFTWVYCRTILYQTDIRFQNNSAPSIFIDDLGDGCEKTLYLCADDSTLFCEIRPSNDSRCVTTSLNRHLERMRNWADKWKVTFELCKCKVLTTSRRIQQGQVHSLETSNCQRKMSWKS